MLRIKMSLFEGKIESATDFILHFLNSYRSAGSLFAKEPAQIFYSQVWGYPTKGFLAGGAVPRNEAKLQLTFSYLGPLKKKM